MTCAVSPKASLVALLSNKFLVGKRLALIKRGITLAVLAEQPLFIFFYKLTKQQYLVLSGPI